MTADILKLLETQQELLLRVEEATNQMLYAEADTLPEIVADRGTHLERATGIQGQINQMVIGDAALAAALDGSCDADSLTADEAELFRASLRVKAAVNRIRSLESDVMERLEEERDSALKRLEELNKSSNRVATSYGQGVQTGFTRSLDEGNRSV